MKDSIRPLMEPVGSMVIMYTSTILPSVQINRSELYFLMSELQMKSSFVLSVEIKHF